MFPIAPPRLLGKPITLVKVVRTDNLGSVNLGFLTCLVALLATRHAALERRGSTSNFPQETLHEDRKSMAYIAALRACSRARMRP